jgi:hypothetical protein
VGVFESFDTTVLLCLWGMNENRTEKEWKVEVTTTIRTTIKIRIIVGVSV